MTSPQPPEQRAALQAVTAAALVDLSEQWATLDLSDAVAVRNFLAELVPALADEYGAAAVELASDVYSALRDDAGVSGGYDVIGGKPNLDSLQADVRWAVDPLFGADPDGAAALGRISGATQKSVADQYRSTVQQTVIADPKGGGWQRVTRPEGCPFCTLLASRGYVYTEVTVEFGSHTNCHCLAVPAFAGVAKPVKEYVPTTRTITDADRARTRRYMRAHGLLSGKARGEV